MARSDLITSLVKASALGDQNLVKQTVEAMIAEEKSKQHHLFAEKLSSAYQSGKNSALAFMQPKQSNLNNYLNHSPTQEIDDFLLKIHPQKQLDELFLTNAIFNTCSELIEEQLRADLLRSHAIEPRSRVLLAGSPGNGKTSLAEAIAFELGLELYVVRYEAIIGSFLGETSSRLRKVFDFVRTRPCVIFFDEFDTVGKERGDTHETGEIKRVVSTLLLQIDDLPSYNVVVAATNHAELIDRAAWRRFQIRLELLPPNVKQIRRLLEKFEQSLGMPLGYPSEFISSHLNGLSYSEIEQFLLDIRRRWILRMESSNLKSITAERLSQLQARFTVRKQKIIKNGKASTNSFTESEQSVETERQSKIF